MPETLPSPTDKLTARIDGHIGWLVLDNPTRRNALTLAMWRAVPELVAALDAHPDVRVIVVRGAGDGPFASGADISEFETVRATAEGARAYEAANAEAFAGLSRAAKPTVAMIRSFCLGGGLGLAIATDLRIAGDSAEFGIPAGRLGVGYPPDAMVQVVAALGPMRAKELFFTARRIKAPEALQAGLLTRVVADDTLEAEVRQLAESIAANAPLTLRAAKAAINASAGLDDRVPAALRALADACFDSADYAEGRIAFLEKRAPQFRGA
ncbi:enoyl-CoA hydratase [Blastochloris sulfoviridis]|uniref:Enoyl-CoA hydratase n=1 Tax=Blastochloris sulfoviridis TaxID=50712 RepID=A0A5M6HQN7_9HYPH|nr:enoyl-CoA hydratase [Blastochloris sulfoviridis]KAA5598192.1 enoyl-CoA hydratase [Blastochloris sulfoviridis]